MPLHSFVLPLKGWSPILAPLQGRCPYGDLPIGFSGASIVKVIHMFIKRAFRFLLVIVVLLWISGHGYSFMQRSLGFVTVEPVLVHRERHILFALSPVYRGRVSVFHIMQ